MCTSRMLYYCTTPNNAMSSFTATAVIFHRENTLQTEEVWASEIEGRSLHWLPQHLKSSIEYLVKISLEDDILAPSSKPLAVKMGIQPVLY